MTCWRSFHSHPINELSVIKPAELNVTKATAPCTAMLLAAGRGERMRPLTDSTAKPLLKVAGKRLIDYHLEKLCNAGVRQVVVNTSWCAEEITSTLGDGSAYGLQIDYSHEPTALETAGGIRKALHLLGDKPFLVISTDVWCDIDYGDLLSDTTVTGAHLLMVGNPAHHPGGDFAIGPGNQVQLKNEYDEGNPVAGTYTYSGIGLYHPSLFKTLSVAACPLRDVLFPTIKAGEVSATIHNGQWFDVGTVDRLRSLDKFLRSQH